MLANCTIKGNRIQNKNHKIVIMRIGKSVLFGLFVTFVVGLVLFPVMLAIFDSTFSFSFGSAAPDPREQLNTTILICSYFVWILVATVAGGFWAAKIAEGKEDFIVLLMLICTFLIILIVSKGELMDLRFSEVWSTGLTFIIGYAVGAWWGSRSRKKMLRKKIEAVNSIGQPEQE